MAKNKLREVAGTRIRRQYFNVFAWYEFVLPVGCALPMLVMNTLWGPRGTKLNSWSEIFTHILLVDLFFISPLLIASLFNRRFFGKIVCVLNEKGVYYLYGQQKRVAKWEEIEEIEYCIRLWPFFMTNRVWCHARLKGSDFDVMIDQAPMMLLQKARAYDKRVKLRLEKTGVIFVALSAGIAVGISILLGLALIL